jgi:hypothetical protein
MKKLFAFLTVYLGYLSYSFSQCAMCKAMAEQGSKDLEFGYNINVGIIFLMVMPYILIFLFFRKQIIHLVKSFFNKNKGEQKEG